MQLSQITFVTDVPVSTKNSRALRRTRSGKMVSVKTPRQRAAIETIQADLGAALAELGVDETPEGGLWGEDSVAVKVVHLVDDDLVEVTVRRMGPKPPGKTGRGRDLQNMQEAICDAMQGLLFKNDRQVVHMEMERDVQ